MIIRILLLLCALSSSALCATRSDVRLNTRVYWGEVYTDLSYYPDSIVNAVINDAQALIAHVGMAIERDTTINLVENRGRYALPSNFDGCIGVFNWNDATGQITQDFMTWDTFSKGLADATVQQYSIWANYLYSFPRPTEGEDSILVLYYAKALDMDADTTTCQLPAHWVSVLPQIATDLLKVKDKDDPQFLLQLEQKILAFRREHVKRQSAKEVPQQ